MNAIVICDFVAPLPEIRAIIKPDCLVWVNTIKESRFSDTNRLFIEPDNYNFRVTDYNFDNWADKLIEYIL